jgi:IS30 family transposase
MEGLAKKFILILVYKNKIRMSHLTLKQRYEIEIGLAKKLSISEIGELIGKDRSVISREIKRNVDLRYRTYKTELAHKKALERQRSKPREKHWNQSMIVSVGASTCIDLED